MKQIKAEYIDHMGDDLTVVNAARVSFDKESQQFTYRKDVPKGSDEGLIEYLAEHNHWTPFAHCVITLRETVPIFVARQRFKHAVGFTYNEVSRRYVDTHPEIYIPDAWRKRPEGSVKQGSGSGFVQEITLYEDENYTMPIHMVYEDTMRNCIDLYDSMLASGVAPEMARMVLPQSMMTSYYVTGSLAAFARAYNLRKDEGSQVEIQYLAEQWDKIIKPLYPNAWSKMVGC